MFCWNSYLQKNQVCSCQQQWTMRLGCLCIVYSHMINKQGTTIYLLKFERWWISFFINSNSSCPFQLTTVSLGHDLLLVRVHESCQSFDIFILWALHVSAFRRMRMGMEAMMIDLLCCSFLLFVFELGSCGIYIYFSYYYE